MAFFSAGIILYILFVAFVFGAVFGSAMNCLALRIVRHEKWGGKSRSKCPSCGHTLGALDLIPVVSYLTLGGKCRYCKTKISPRYLIAELVLGLSFVLIALKTLTDINAAYEYSLAEQELYTALGTVPEVSPFEAFQASIPGRIANLVLNLVFASCVFALSLADLESFEIPDRFILIPAVFRVITVFLFGADTRIFGNGCGALNAEVTWTEGFLTLADTLIVGAAVGVIFLLFSLFMDKILKKDSLGGGDIKLFALSGLFLRPAVMLLCVLLSCILGLFVAMLTKKNAEPEDEASAETGETLAEDDDTLPEGAVPFGPAISAAAFLCILYGEKILSLYLSLTGLQ